MKKFIYRFTLTLTLLAVLGYCGVSYFLLSGITSGSYKPLVEEPDTTKVSYKNISFKPRGSDFKLMGWFLSAQKPTQKTIICVHGIASNRVSNKYSLSLAYDLTNSGYNVLMFDQRNHYRTTN